RRLGGEQRNGQQQQGEWKGPAHGGILNQRAGGSTRELSLIMAASASWLSVKRSVVPGRTLRSWLRCPSSLPVRPLAKLAAREGAGQLRSASSKHRISTWIVG